MLTKDFIVEFARLFYRALVIVDLHADFSVWPENASYFPCDHREVINVIYSIAAQNGVETVRGERQRLRPG